LFQFGYLGRIAAQINLFGGGFVKNYYMKDKKNLVKTALKEGGKIFSKIYNLCLRWLLEGLSVLSLLLMAGLFIILVFLIIRLFWSPYLDNTKSIKCIFSVLVLIPALGVFYVVAKKDRRKKFRKWIDNNKWFLLIISILVVLAASVWLVIVKSVPSTSSNIDGVAMLSVLMAFVAITNFIVFEINKRDIETKKKELEDEIKKATDDEQKITKATARRIASHALWTNFRLQPQRIDGYIDEAIAQARIGVESLNGLNREKYEAAISSLKNNLAFFLAVRGNQSDAENAFNLAKYIYQVATSEQASKLTATYIYKATWALVLARFYHSEASSRKEARRVLLEILDDATIATEEKDRLQERWEFIFKKPFHAVMDGLNRE
jgi:hypothetical protein